MEGGVGTWVPLILGVIPLLFVLAMWWNEILYVLPVNLRSKRVGGKLPPGSMGIPFLGEMLTFLWYFKFLGRPDDFINSKRKRYGDGIGIYKTHLFGCPAIISFSPATSKFIFQSTEAFVLEWPTVEVVGAKALVALQGSSHTRLRGYVTTAINKPNALRRIAILVQPGVVSGLASWAKKGRILAFDETRKVTFANVGRLFASLEPGPALDTLDELFTDLLKGVRAYPIKFPGTAFHGALQSRKKLDVIFRGKLEEKRNKNKDCEMNDDLMDGLMKIEDEEGNRLSDEEIIDNIVSLIVAGYESTALASMWAIYYLAKYPHVLNKLREENNALSKEKNGEFITSEDVSTLKYTNKVVEETIRMANIAAFVFRTATKDVEYKGYVFPKGWKVIPWIRYMHTNPENFDDPMSFNPDRWNDPAKPGTYQVFGGGPRICAGNMLARIQLSILIHHLTVGYKWELVNPNAEIIHLSHPKPSDNVEVLFSRI
ncbi:unnamed protein product [Rhodiola kirilowii]